MGGFTASRLDVATDQAYALEKELCGIAEAIEAALSSARMLEETLKTSGTPTFLREAAQRVRETIQTLQDEAERTPWPPELLSDMIEVRGRCAAERETVGA